MTAKTFAYCIDIQRPGVKTHRLYFATFTDRERRIKRLLKEHFVGRLEPYYWNEGECAWEFDQETAQSLWMKPELDRTAMLEDLSAQCLLLAQQKDALSGDQLQELEESFQEFFSLFEEPAESPF